MGVLFRALSDIRWWALAKHGMRSRGAASSRAALVKGHYQGCPTTPGLELPAGGTGAIVGGGR